MRRYETMIIADPDLSDDARLPLFEKIREVISQHKGEVIVSEEWGNQKLAYEIRKKSRGFYVRIDFCGTGKAVDEMERFCRIDDRVLKYITIVLEDNTTPDKVREDLARKAEAKAKPTLPDELPPSDAEAPVMSEPAPEDKQPEDKQTEEPVKEIVEDEKASVENEEK